MKNKIIKMIVLGGAAIAMFFMIRYNSFTYSQKRKKRQPSRETNDNVYPDLSDPQWKKIGKISRLMIYPIKSSVEAVRYTSCVFFDYGMCKLYYNTHFYDGMFIVYNRTRDKFEDAQRYPLLQRMKANVTNPAKVTLSYKMNSIVQLNIRRDRIPSSRFLKETWSGGLGLFYDSNQQVNTWVKGMIEATQVNETDDDIILTQMKPSKWLSMDKIKDNWSRFVQGYETMEEDETGKLITLPRFVLMTSQTYQRLITRIDANVAPNIIIDTNELMNPFEEKNWDWIKIGNEIILKKVKPVPRGHLNKEFEHRGIYCGLFIGGIAEKDDDVFIYSSN